jgi:hypothetical protein
MSQGTVKYTLKAHFRVGIYYVSTSGKRNIDLESGLLRLFSGDL